MVSKRRSMGENEAGPSKKRVRAEEKAKLDENSTTDTKKKRVRKTKVAKDPLEQSEEINFVNVLDVKEEIPEEVKIVDQDPIRKPEAIHSNYGLPNWPMPHMSELLRRIETVLPQDDQMVYKSRAEKLDWNEIAFDNYSGAECRLMWESISKRIRRYRILRELVDDAKNWISKPWTNFYRGSKNNRHPDLPRRPLSTYMIFYLKKKDKVLEENPGLEMTDLSKHIAEMYKKLSIKSKKKYKELADLQRKEYDEKMEEFHRLHPDLIPNNTRSMASANDNIPKKPATPFKLYCEDKMKRSEHEVDFDKNTFLERCKEQWRNMSDKKKVFWINWAFEKEVKFQEEMKKYISENPEYVPGSLKGILTKEERTIRERMAGKPEKPPNSAYSLFSRLMLASEDVKSVTPKERMLLIAQQWKNCTDVEKKEYNDRVKHMLEQYKLQYAEYLESLPEDKRQEELLNNQPKRRVRTSSKQKTAEGTVNKRVKKLSEVKAPKKKIDKIEITTSTTKKDNNLYEGEPEPPPATPYLLFVKSYQSSYPDRQDAQEVWENMSEEQRSFHRRVLWDMKKVYIESYENFLKGLTQEELKEYSEWKKTAKLANHDSEATSDESGSDSDQECSSNSESEAENKPTEIKQEASEDSSSSE